MLKCDMQKECNKLITHIDRKGYIYCTPHADRRKTGGMSGVRLLRPSELRRLAAGETIKY
jgi:hypothetical protein